MITKHMSSHKERRQSRLQRWEVFIAGGLSLAVLAFVFFASHAAYKREHRQLGTELEYRCAQAALAIQKDLTSAITVVESLASLIRVTNDLSATHFTNYTRPLLERHHSLEALGFNPRVSHQERSAFEARIRAQGFQSYAIRESTASQRVPASPRTEYVPVGYIEPYEKHGEALGYDIASEPIRRDALTRARETKQPAATAPIVLVQHLHEDELAFLLCHPVFRPTDETSDTQREPFAFAVGVFKIESLVLEALGPARDLGIVFRLDDTTDPESVRLVHSQLTDDVGPPAAEFTQHASIEFGGREWTLRARPTAQLSNAFLTRTPLFILITGGVLAGMLLSYLLLLIWLDTRVRESEGKFRMLAEHIPEVFWIGDPHRRELTYVSPADEDIWGQPLPESRAIDDAFLGSTHESDRAKVVATLDRQLRGEPTTCEYRIVRPDGEERWIRDLAFPVRDANGSVREVVGVAEDVTARKRAVAEREALDRKVTQSQKLEGLGILAGGVAHDFNNLLTVILGHVELASSKLPTNPESAGVRSDLQKIAEASLRGSELTKQMLAYSGHGSFIVCPLNLSEIVGRMSRLVESTVTQKATVNYGFPPKLPAVEGDANQIQQLALNLITNAAESSVGTGKQISISTGVVEMTLESLAQTYLDDDLPAGSYVYLEVEDEGCGIPPETLEQIFDPFFSTKFAGRGLGLAAVIGIVRAHRGAIDIATEVGRGTRVRVLFPQSLLAVRDSPDVVTQKAALRGDASVLIVDDDPSVLSACQGVLECCGFRVQAVESGRQALDAIRNEPNRFDIALVDLTMPEMDGIETFRCLREFAPKLPIILQSGYSNTVLKERYADIGFYDFVQKPSPADHLEATLRQALATRVAVD